ncbi:hypothetical protein PXD56_02570 [Maribacter sp. SA7]|uniref:hypothetical protein n=1 Tax=Maribacter zhoushanensis TaxID=3030012 RepID=UPI0023EAE65C|nr:hypothetical protein [Maribacter zhoushanensis]MDF4201821.1 hypothetical protein [Maribacter zhoushanensis]
MSKFSAEKQLISKISELLNNLEIDINEGKELYSRSNLKWAISKLDPDYNFNYTIKEINDFESKYNTEIDSTEYIEEASNYLFHTKVKSLVVGNAKKLFKQITDVNDTGNIDRVIELVEQKIISYHNLKKEDYGREYFDLSYGANRFEHRFEVIWFYNERNRYKLNKLINPTLPPSLHNVENPILHFSDYPFLGIDIQQWIDFEKAYRFIPLLIEILQFLHKSKNEFIKFQPNYNLENVLKKENRFPNIFKDAIRCELFFHTAQFLPINNDVDWTYLFQILEIDKAFRKKITQNQYVDLVNKSFKKDLKQLRFDTSESKYNKLYNLYRENKNTFEYLVKAYKH